MPEIIKPLSKTERNYRESFACLQMLKKHIRSAKKLAFPMKWYLMDIQALEREIESLEHQYIAQGASRERTFLF